MEERKENIFEFIKDKDYTPMKAKEIALLLGVPKNDYNDFLNILKQLEDEYKIRSNTSTAPKNNSRNDAEE